MNRGVWLFVLAMLLGAASMKLALRSWADEEGGTSAATILSEDELNETNVDPAIQIATEAEGFLADSMLRIDEVSRITDTSGIESQIRQLRQRTISGARQEQLLWLLLRYLELDSDAAVAFALDSPLETRLIASMFSVWAELEPNRALQSLSAIGDTRIRRTIALELLESNPEQFSSTDDLAQLLPERDRAGLTADALIRRAAHAPESAMRRVGDLSGWKMREHALKRIAQSWSLQDPNAAIKSLENLRGLPAMSRNEAWTGAVQAWASRDPDGVLTYLQGDTGRRYVGLRCSCTNETIEILAASRPEAFLRFADSMPVELGGELQRIAVEQSLFRDPAAMLREIETMPVGVLRAEWVQAIADVYPEIDPAGALLWAARDERSAEAQLHPLSRVLLNLYRAEESAAPGSALLFSIDDLEPEWARTLFERYISDPDERQFILDRFVNMQGV